MKERHSGHVALSLPDTQFCEAWINSPACKKGTSLVELIVTLSVASTLFLMATAWIHQSFFLASKTRDHQRHHESLMRLSRQLRDDVHDAIDAKLPDPTSLVLNLNPGTVRYQWTDGTIQRTKRVDLDAETASHETYRLNANAGVSFQIESEDLVAVAVTRPQRTGLHDESAPLDLSVQARIGRLGTTQ